MTPVTRSHLLLGIALCFALVPIRLPAAASDTIGGRPISVTPSTNTQSRPFIWTRLSERDVILTRIHTQDWAAAQFALLQKRADAAVTNHQADRDAFLRKLPLDTSRGVPRFLQTLTNNKSDRSLLQTFRAGVDCAAIYYLTGDEKYARCAADILHNSVLGYVNVTPHAGDNGGWIYADGLLGEASESGMYLPVIYDYLYNYLKATHQVYQLQTTGGTEVTYAAADFANAQKVFRTFHQLTRDRGLANNNWSPNMAKSLVPCALALDDPAEREDALQDYLVRDHPRQTSLQTDAARYPNPGDIWPESLDYSEGVNTIHPYLMVMLDHYDPTLNLFKRYPNVAQSMARPFQLVYPNGRQIHFGDFHHDDSRQPYFQYELVYGHAQALNLPHLRELYGPLINAAIAAGIYSRSNAIANSPLPLFWFADTVTESPTKLQIPRTDTLSHAGVALQRNLSPNHNPVDGLMGFVGGGAHVHSHATGMNLELYGQGTTLGADAGKGNYKSELHENYYRLFAGHNTVIVNGASGSDGGWANLGINTVQVEAMEPQPFQAGVSPQQSFTCTSFLDDKRPGVEATQQRTLAIIRTSPTSGYYVDVFRSKSARPNEFHDYLYHNIGDAMSLATAQGELKVQPSSGRYVPVAGTVWKPNQSYLFPGWQYFKEPRTSAPTPADVFVDFSTMKLQPSPIHMRLFIPGCPGRDYTQALAPETKSAPAPYATQPTPVLVIHQQGEAWDHPFAVVYEPFAGDGTSGSIQSTTALETNGAFAGFKVVSRVDGQLVTQYVLVQPTATSVYENTALGISFRGRYAVITVNASGGCTALYLGEGSRLRFQGCDLHGLGEIATAASAEINGVSAAVTAVASAELTLPGGRRVASTPITH
jgi:hypothetical protein